MIWKSLICLSSILLSLAPAESQEASAVIHIKLINGLNDRPLNLADVGVEISPGYRELKVKTDEHGVATLHVSSDSTIYLHNTKTVRRLRRGRRISS